MNFDAKIRNISERIKQDNDYVASNKEFAADSHPFAMNKTMDRLKVGLLKWGILIKPILTEAMPSFHFAKPMTPRTHAKHESIKRLQVKTKKNSSNFTAQGVKTIIINY